MKLPCLKVKKNRRKCSNFEEISFVEAIPVFFQFTRNKYNSSELRLGINQTNPWDKLSARLTYLTFHIRSKNLPDEYFWIDSLILSSIFCFHFFKLTQWTKWQVNWKKKVCFRLLYFVFSSFRLKIENMLI